MSPQFRGFFHALQLFHFILPRPAIMQVLAHLENIYLTIPTTINQAPDSSSSSTVNFCSICQSTSVIGVPITHGYWRVDWPPVGIRKRLCSDKFLRCGHRPPKESNLQSNHEAKAGIHLDGQSHGSIATTPVRPRFTAEFITPPFLNYCQPRYTAER